MEPGINRGLCASCNARDQYEISGVVQLVPANVSLTYGR
jgi:hypothetical protein